MSNLKKNFYAFLHLCVGGAILLFSGLLFLTFVMMTYSESWEVKLAREAIQVETDEVHAFNNGKLVYFTTFPESNETLSDPEFGVTLHNVVRLKRVVEMLQWKEKKKKHYSSKRYIKPTYTYSKVWSSPLINSKKFEKPFHENPTKKVFKTETWNVETLSAGCYKLDKKQIIKLNSWRPVSISKANKIPEAGVVKLNSISFKYGSSATDDIGDLRVRFFYVEPTEVTICGQQNNESIRPYNVGNKDQVFYIEEGEYKPTEFMAPQAERRSSVGKFVAGLAIFCLFLGLGYIIKKVPPLLAMEEQNFQQSSDNL